MESPKLKIKLPKMNTYKSDIDSPIKKYARFSRSIYKIIN
jgi:hypothetical protein